MNSCLYLIGCFLPFENNRYGDWTRGGGNVEGHGSLCLVFAVLPLRQQMPRLRQRKGCERYRPGFPLAKASKAGAFVALRSLCTRRGRCRLLPSLSTRTTPLAGQCLPCQNGTYILGGGGKECTPCPSGTGFCPGKDIVIPKPGHWQAQRCRSG